MTTVSIRAMNARQFSDWVTRLNLRQITAGPSTYSSALMARGMPSRSGNGHIARFNRKGSLQLHAVSAWGLLSWGTGIDEAPSFSNVHSRSPLRRAQIPRLNHGRSVSLRPGIYVKGGFGSAKSAPPMPAVPPPFSGCREIPHALRRAQLAPPSSQPVVDFPAVRDRDRCERLPSQASGCRNPQLHLMPCIIPVIRVALRASRPMCRPGQAYAAHAHAPRPRARQPSCRFPAAAYPASPARSTHHMGRARPPGSTAHGRSHICPPKYWLWMMSPIWNS
jgi:hypothetical protein